MLVLACYAITVPIGCLFLPETYGSTHENMHDEIKNVPNISQPVVEDIQSHDKGESLPKRPGVPPHG